nr:hypothetical protein [Tanacetum cinerariifolium]
NGNLKASAKDKDGEEVDVHMYRSMIGSLMYLTSSRLDIMFAVCACARYQVIPKVSHLHAVKSIFRLIAWQCKKQTLVANSTTLAEYVAASKHVVDEAKEMDDSLERAATTATSLDVKQYKGISLVSTHNDEQMFDADQDLHGEKRRISAIDDDEGISLVSTHDDEQMFDADQDLHGEKVNKARAVMSSASSAVSYTFVYTDYEPGRVFWEADEELSDEGSARVIVYGYDGLPMQPVAPPSPYYITGPEELQTPPVSQNEDEREPIFIQPHDHDYVLEPMYPEYIPLEDEHVLLAEEQPLPLVVSPTVKSPGYVVESDPEEYEDDESEDGSVDYPMNGGDDGDDDDCNSFRDDTNDEEEDEEDGEEHLASADFAVVVPTVEHVSPPEGIEPVIPPPSTDITTTGARITVRLQASISLPLEEEVKRLLAMPTLPPSPLTSLSPPSVGERLARIASTKALIDAVTAALPSPPLPPLPLPLYIPPPVDRRDDIPETELPPHKKEVGYGIRDTWVDSTETVPEIAPMTLGERVDLLMKYRIAHQETILIVEEDAYASREDWAHSIGLSQAVHYELQIHREQVYAHES